MNKLIVFSIFSVLLIVSIALFVVANTEILKITVSNVNTTSGSQNISVPISLENNLTVYGIQLGISHDGYLIFKNISLTSRTENALIGVNDLGNEILIAGIFEEGISAGNDSILNLIFDIDQNANGSYVLNSTEIVGIDLDTDLYSIEFISGNVIVN